MRTNRSSRLWSVALAAALAVMAGGRPAAAAYISFNLNPQGGQGRVSYDGGNAPLVGKNLGLLDVKGLETPKHNDVSLAIEKGTVDFATGAFSGVGGTNPQSLAQAASTSREWQFAPGGSLTVRGGIASLGIDPGTPLLTGQFSDTSFVKGLNGTDLKVQGGALINVVNDKLAAYFGLPVGGSVGYVGGISTLFAAPGSAGDAFSSTGYTSGQVTTTPVPEPATVVVFGLLAAGAVWHRRRTR